MTAAAISGQEDKYEYKNTKVGGMGFDLSARSDLAKLVYRQQDSSKKRGEAGLLADGRDGRREEKLTSPIPMLRVSSSRCRWF